MSFKKVPFTFAVALIAIASQAQANISLTNIQTTVYEQAPAAQPGASNSSFAGAGSFVYNDPTDPGFNWTGVKPEMQSFETFALGTAVIFNRIGWYGNNADGDFAVDLYTATCFSCNVAKVNGSGGFTHTSINPGNGPTLLTQTLFSQAQVHKTFVSSSGGSSAKDLYSYYIDLPTSVNLAANSFTSSGNALNAYGISIVNNYSSQPFGWALSGSATDKHLEYSPFYSQFLPAYGNLAFSLIDTTATPSVSAVPEPETYGMMLAGLGMMGFMVRRLKNEQA
jgi:hypothetical protein